MIRITGHDYKKFDAEPWPADWEVEGCLFTVNGVELEGGDFPESCSIADSDIVTIYGGYILTFDDAKVKPSKDLTYEKMVKTWVKKQTERTVVIVCNKEDFNAMMEAVKKAGGREVKS